jgi:hypothetical protein
MFLQVFAGLWEFGLVTGDELSRKLPVAGWREVHFVNELLGIALDQPFSGRRERS